MIERDSELQETVVHINRVAKVVKGGKNFSFSAVVVAGDGSGKVGYGTGKAREVPPAIQKASEQAKREMIRIPLIGGTVPHAIWGRWGATRVLLRPASPGTGVIAGGGVRAVMESAGVQDVLTKIIGSRNPFNVIRATFDAIDRLMTTDQARRLRGVDVPEIEESTTVAPTAVVRAEESAEESAGVAPAVAGEPEEKVEATAEAEMPAPTPEPAKAEKKTAVKATADTPEAVASEAGAESAEPAVAAETDEKKKPTKKTAAAKKAEEPSVDPAEKAEGDDEAEAATDGGKAES